MNHDDIEQALREEPEITPSPGFAYQVMREVRSQAVDRQALPFPWKPLAAGVGLAAVLTVAGALTGQMPPAPTEPAERLVYLAPGLAWLSTALAGSLGLAWWSFRFAGGVPTTGSSPGHRPPRLDST